MHLISSACKKISEYVKDEYDFINLKILQCSAFEAETRWISQLDLRVSETYSLEAFMSQSAFESSFISKNYHHYYDTIFPGNPSVTAVERIVIISGGSRGIGHPAHQCCFGSGGVLCDRWNFGLRELSAPSTPPIVSPVRMISAHTACSVMEFCLWMCFASGCVLSVNVFCLWMCFVCGRILSGERILAGYVRYKQNKSTHKILSKAKHTHRQNPPTGKTALVSMLYAVWRLVDRLFGIAEQTVWGLLDRLYGDCWTGCLKIVEHAEWNWCWNWMNIADHDEWKLLFKLQLHVQKFRFENLNLRIWIRRFRFGDLGLGISIRGNIGNKYRIVRRTRRAFWPHLSGHRMAVVRLPNLFKWPRRPNTVQKKLMRVPRVWSNGWGHPDLSGSFEANRNSAQFICTDVEMCIKATPSARSNI